MILAGATRTSGEEEGEGEEGGEGEEEEEKGEELEGEEEEEEREEGDRGRAKVGRLDLHTSIIDSQKCGPSLSCAQFHIIEFVCFVVVMHSVGCSTFCIAMATT